MMPPQNQSVNQIAREIAVPAGEQKIERWSTQDKFSIVVETAALNEAELAEYCRKKGLYVEQVQSWRDTCMQANGGVAQEAARIQKELRLKERERKNSPKDYAVRKQPWQKPLPCWY